jgi:hypothetical protein
MRCFALNAGPSGRSGAQAVLCRAARCVQPGSRVADADNPFTLSELRHDLALTPSTTYGQMIWLE